LLQSNDCDWDSQRQRLGKSQAGNDPKNDLAKSALSLFFGAIIIELVRPSLSVAVLAVTRFL
jgi:hypothetical protein